MRFMQVWNFREPVSAWTHFAALLIVMPGMLILLRGHGDRGKRISLLVYGLSLAVCYSASTLYHGVQLKGEKLAFFARLDSMGIFTLIAGTYTPLAWNLMSGPWRTWTLSAVWGTALSAIVLIATGRQFSTTLATAIYLVMGWGVVVCYARISRVVSHRALLPVLVGGLFYSVGAVLNLLQRPSLWPGSFGTHDLFHLFVIAGSLAHYWFILFVVVPFDNQPDGVSPHRDDHWTGSGQGPAERNNSPSQRDLDATD